MLSNSDRSADTIQEASYFPPPGDDWARLEPEAAGMKAEPLAALKEFAAKHESTTWPRSIVNEQGIFNNASITDKAEWNELIGPVKPRGGPNGVILRRGYLVAEWGDTGRADMTFSISKSYLSLLAGHIHLPGVLDNNRWAVTAQVP